MSTLLAVDLGLRTGLALYGGDGRLRWYRSQHYGNVAQLRRAVPTLLADEPDLAWIFIEGGGNLANVWLKAAERRGIRTSQLAAETWREDLLRARQQRTGRDAKQHADSLAREIIAWSGLARPKSLRHDAAEAILVGLWGVTQIGWLTSLPDELRR